MSRRASEEEHLRLNMLVGQMEALITLVGYIIQMKYYGNANEIGFLRQQIRSMKNIPRTPIYLSSPPQQGAVDTESEKRSKRAFEHGIDDVEKRIVAVLDRMHKEALQGMRMPNPDSH